MAKARKSTNASNASSTPLSSTSTSSANIQSAVATVTEEVLAAVQTATEIPTIVNTSLTTDAVTQLENTPVSKESNIVENTTTTVASTTNATGGIQGRYENILNRVKVTQSLLREITSDLILLNREYQRTSRPIQKKKNFKKSDNSRSGITQEVNVSPDLEKFLGLTSGSKISRTSVTRAVTAYIKDQNLQNPNNRRQIILDQTLSKLLNPPENEQVTYFNLQKFLKVHYYPAVSAAKTA
jgi:chromatin remodeling complex protein RSC6